MKHLTTLLCLIFSISALAGYENFTLVSRDVDGQAQVCLQQAGQENCLPRAQDITKEPDVGEMSVLFPDFNLIESSREALVFNQQENFVMPAALINSRNLPAIGGMSVSREKLQFLLDSFDRVDVRDVATPVNILQLLGKQDVSGIDMAQIRINETSVEFPMYFSVFWKPNTGLGLRPSATTFVSVIVNMGRDSDTELSQRLSSNQVNFSEINWAETQIRRLFFSFFIGTSSPDEETQKILEETIIPYVTKTVFAAQLLVFLGDSVTAPPMQPTQQN